MVKPVDALIPLFAQAGASIISFHPEASEHVDRTLQLIRSHGVKAGLVLNPATPLHWLDHMLDQLDLVLLMSVNPGFGGQCFIESVLPKIEAVRRAHRRERARHLARGRRRRECRQRAAQSARPAPTRWSPARPCSAAADYRRRDRGAARRCRRRAAR